MICPRCNKDNHDGATFCVNCGNRLIPVEPVITSAPVNPYEYKDPTTNNQNSFVPPSNTQQFVSDHFEIPNQNQYTPQPQEPIQTISEDEKTNKTAKKLAIISLCLFFGRYVLAILGGILSGLVSFVSNYSSSSYNYSYSSSGIASLFGLILSGISFLAYIAAIVLIIIAKVKVSSKHLKNKFVTVVFWVEIGLIIANIVLVIFLVFIFFIACGAMVNSCS